MVSTVAMLTNVNQRAARDVVELKVLIVRGRIEEESSEVQASASKCATKTHIQRDFRRIVVEACVGISASSDARVSWRQVRTEVSVLADLVLYDEPVMIVEGGAAIVSEQ